MIPKKKDPAKHSGSVEPFFLCRDFFTAPFPEEEIRGKAPGTNPSYILFCHDLFHKHAFIVRCAPCFCPSSALCVHIHLSTPVKGMLINRTVLRQPDLPEPRASLEGVLAERWQMFPCIVSKTAHLSRPSAFRAVSAGFIHMHSATADL